jgi:hypothetical protein
VRERKRERVARRGMVRRENERGDKGGDRENESRTQNAIARRERKERG